MSIDSSDPRVKIKDAAGNTATMKKKGQRAPMDVSDSDVKELLSELLEEIKALHETLKDK
jgi:hypothetical protein